MRLFVAIDFSQQVKTDLIPVSELHPKLKLVPKQNLHLTLQFIGETDDKEFVHQQLSQVKFESFKMTVTGKGYFSARKRGYPIWYGVEKNENLIGLQMQVEGRLSSLGLPDERHTYQPHITIGRVKGVTPRILEDLIVQLPDQECEIMVNEFHLFESYGTEDGLAYKKITTYTATNL
jgi:2'-5' RNA ligase